MKNEGNTNWGHSVYAMPSSQLPSTGFAISVYSFKPIRVLRLSSRTQPASAQWCDIPHERRLTLHWRSRRRDTHPHLHFWQTTRGFHHACKFLFRSYIYKIYRFCCHSATNSRKHLYLKEKWVAAMWQQVAAKFKKQPKNNKNNYKKAWKTEKYFVSLYAETAY